MLSVFVGENDLVQHDWTVDASDDVPVKRILFDETHGELLEHRDTTELRAFLGTLPGIIAIDPNDIKSDESTLGNGLLDEHNVDVLVLAAPTIPFSLEEIGAIKFFLRQGKSLLFANNHDSLGHSQATQQINDLLKDFGLQAQRLFGYRASNIQSFLPHYLSSGIDQLVIEDPTCLKPLSDKPLVVIALPGSGKPFLAAVEIESCRVIAVGDTSFLRNGKIKQGDNQILALNIFRWLTSKNFIDLQSVRIASEVRYGKCGRFSVELTNSCTTERLEGVQCLLESHEIALIDKPQASIRSIAVMGTVQQSWQIEPQELGLQSLSLTVKIPAKCGGTTFRIDPVAQFQCIPDAEITLVIDNQKGEVQEIVETGTPFDVSARVRWEENAKRLPLHFSLEGSLSSFAVEQVTGSRWRLTALSDGNYVITLKVKETAQKITRLIYVKPSPNFKISKVEREIISELESKIAHRLSQNLPELTIEAIQQIPFKLLTPEDYIGKVYPVHMQEQLMEILSAIRLEEEVVGRLIDDLLFYVAPMYSPKYGCCIPYDPELATHLIRKYPLYKEGIAYNFLWAENSPVYGCTWLKGNIAALLLHEKYGHGFFYTQTKLGQQLSILYRHGLLRKVDNEVLREPYTRMMHKEYGRVIPMISHSAILLSEGFSTWLEFVGLHQLGGAFEEAVYRRKEFLFQDTGLEQLCARSEYFKEFDPRPGSKYELGYIWLEGIQSHFSVKSGLKSVLDTVIKAANVDFGISENDGRVEFSLTADQIRNLLLDSRKGFEAGAQLRLGQIWDTVGEYFDKASVRKAYQNQQHIASRTDEASLDEILDRELGW